MNRNAPATNALTGFAYALGVGVLALLSGCTPKQPEAPTPGVPAAERPTLREYGTRLREEVYRYRMQPLAWGVSSESSYLAVRPCLDILRWGAEQFAVLEARKAPWAECAQVFETHVRGLIDQLQKEGMFTGDEPQFDFANPQLAEVGALVQLLYGTLNRFLSAHGFWPYNYDLYLIPLVERPQAGGQPHVVKAVTAWRKPAGLYAVSAVNPPELLRLHPELHSATANLVMLRRRQEPDLTRNIGLAPGIAALAEGQSVLIMEDKLERDNSPLEDLVQRKASLLTELASVDFATAVQGRIGFVKDPRAGTIRTYGRRWSVESNRDAAVFSFYRLAFNVCSRFGRQTIAPHLTRYELAAFYASHEIEHLKYARGDDEDNERLNRAYLNVDVFAHTAPEQAARLSSRARVQQETEADIAALAQAPAGGLLAWLTFEMAEPTTAKVAAMKNPLGRLLWSLVRAELLKDPDQYGLSIVPEEPAAVARAMNRGAVEDTSALLQRMRAYAERSTQTQEEFVIYPGAHALWPMAQVLGQSYRIAESPQYAQRLAEALRRRLALDQRRSTLVHDIESDQLRTTNAPPGNR